MTPPVDPPSKAEILPPEITAKHRFVPSGAAFLDLGQQVGARDYYFVLLPRMTMLAFSAAVEPLRLANQLTGKCLYRWFLFSEDGNPVRCSNSISIAVDSALLPVRRHDTVIICSGGDGYQSAGPKTLGLLRSHHRNGGLIGGICTGAFTLARAGLLQGQKFTLHWDNQAAFVERFPDLPVSDQIFEKNEHVITCGGGAAGTDLMLSEIESHHGNTLSQRVADLCVHGVRRKATAGQKSPISTAISTRNQRLIMLVRLMHDNIEEPLSFEAMTEIASISKRQMERLFQRYLGVSPAQYYKNIRLDHSRSLVIETDMSVTEIAFASGFPSQATFSKSYKRRFGENPGTVSAAERGWSDK